MNQTYIACSGCMAAVDSLDEFAVAHMSDGPNRYFCAKCWRLIKSKRSKIIDRSSERDGRFPEQRDISIMKCEGCNRLFDSKEGWGAFDWHLPYMTYGCDKNVRFRVCIPCMETMIKATEEKQ